MRRGRSVLSVIVILLVLIGVLYYFYGYRQRGLSLDLRSVRATTNDAATTTAVKTALALSNRVAGSSISVESNNGVVTLTGQVPSEEDKKQAGDITSGTKGVTSVNNNLTVNPQVVAANDETPRVTDLEIKVAVLQGLLNNPDLKTQQINADVTNGVVRLTGTVQDRKSV